MESAVEQLLGGSMTLSSSVTSWFTWDYAQKDSKILELYERAKTAQWSATTDIDWSVPIEFGAPLPEAAAGHALQAHGNSPVPDSEWNRFRWEYHAWMTSQFLHGEQGALLATARLVETVPDLEAKFYAASQVADEARHTEAYGLYLHRLGQWYPINEQLRTMLQHIITESRWDVVFLGMQIIIEGIGIALFRLGTATAYDPAIRQITALVAKDESRHVAFGIQALDGYYQGLTSRELADREEFIMEAVLLVCRRFRLEEVWDRVGVDVGEGVHYATTDPAMIEFRKLMFSRIVSALQRLGLFTPRLRAHFEDLSLLRGSR
jgi:hypothetical protein